MAKRRKPRPPGYSAEDKADSKLATYMAGSLVFEHSKIPGTDKPFVWRKLSSRQKQFAVAAAVRQLEKVEIPQGLRSYADLEDEIAIQVLHLAMRDPDVEGTDFDPYPRTLATNADELGLLIDEDVRDLLAIEYRDLEEDTSPREEQFDADEMKALEAAIEKKSRRLLNSFGPRILRHWLITSGSPQSS